MFPAEKGERYESMDRSRKVNCIVAFVRDHPESLASRTICRRLFHTGYTEISEELAADLKDKLLGLEDEDTLNSYFYMVK